jgi:hypothetical protein
VKVRDVAGRAGRHWGQPLRRRATEAILPHGPAGAAYDRLKFAALLDRLTHHSQVLLFEGESYRVRESAGRLTKPRRKTSQVVNYWAIAVVNYWVDEHTATHNVPEDTHCAVAEAGYTWSPVKIGDGVWIAAHACVLPGAELGDGVVVAAGAVVTVSVEPGAVVAGVPARTVRRRRV